MKAVKNNGELMAEARRSEQAGDWAAAAADYERLVRENPDDREVVKRILMIYRKLKDYHKELKTINASLEAVAERDKSAQAKWLAANPQAAKLGKAMMKSLGGTSVTAYGTDNFVARLLKRKDLVERKISGTKRTMVKKAKTGVRRGVLKSKEVRMVTGKRAPALTAREKAATTRRAKLEKRHAEKAAAAAKKAFERASIAEKKREEAAAKKAVAEVKRQAAVAERARAAEKRAAKRQEAAAQKALSKSPSLFVVSLSYLVPLEKIDAFMARHVAFLEKHFASGDFLVSGRQVPRTGGIIIARGENRAAVERMMRQDPFVKARLAKADIVEFKASQIGKDLKNALKF